MNLLNPIEPPEPLEPLEPIEPLQQPFPPPTAPISTPRRLHGVYKNLKHLHACAQGAFLAVGAILGVGLLVSGAEASELREGDLAAGEFRASDPVRACTSRSSMASLTTVSRHAGQGQRRRADGVIDARVAYTLDLIRILQALLPEGLDGGVSTTPLSYKAWWADAGPEAWETMTRNVVRVADGACANPARAWNAHRSGHCSRARLRPREHGGVGRVLRAVVVLGWRPHAGGFAWHQSGRGAASSPGSHQALLRLLPLRR